MVKTFQPFNHQLFNCQLFHGPGVKMPDPVTTITLHATELPGLVVADDCSHTGIRSTVAKTLNGGLVIWERPELAGREIDLVGGDDFGWLARSALKTLQGLASIAGATYILVTPEESITVRFRNETPPAIEATPIVSRPNQADTDYYKNVKIKLMEV
jgi:hypothetical protein